MKNLSEALFVMARHLGALYSTLGTLSRIKKEWIPTQPYASADGFSCNPPTSLSECLEDSHPSLIMGMMAWTIAKLMSSNAGAP